MDTQRGYADAVHRLSIYGYAVLSDEQGYTVRHLTDRDDVSHAGKLDELVELADLMEWAAQRRKSGVSTGLATP